MDQIEHRYGHSYCVFTKKIQSIDKNLSGGKIFNTTRSTIVDKEPHSMLARMFEQSQLSPADLDRDGAYLIGLSIELSLDLFPH